MSDIEKNRPSGRYPEGDAKQTFRPGGSMPGGGATRFHYEIQGNRMMLPLLGCPLMLLMMFFIVILSAVAFIISIFGGRRAGEIIMKRAAGLRGSPGAGRFHGNDPDVIDVEGKVIDPDQAGTDSDIQ